MTTSVRALYMKMLWWSDQETAEQYSDDLNVEGLNSWVEAEGRVVAIELRGSVSYARPGSAIFQLGSQSDAIIVSDPEEVEEILTEEDAT